MVLNLGYVGRGNRFTSPLSKPLLNWTVHTSRIVSQGFAAAGAVRRRRRHVDAPAGLPEVPKIIEEIQSGRSRNRVSLLFSPFS